MSRKINELIFFGNESSMAKILVLREQLDLAISYSSGMQQGLGVDDPEYKRGEEIVQNALRDLAAGLLGREIAFTSVLPYPYPNPASGCAGTDVEAKSLAMVIDKGFQLAQDLGYTGNKLHYVAAVMPMPSLISVAPNANSPAAQPTANHKRIDGDTWVVLTQAGFNHILREFIKETHESSVERHFKNTAGFPTVYPSVVTLTWGYRGDEYVRATCIPLNLVKQGCR